MSSNLLNKPSGIRPPTSRLTKPLGRSNGSSELENDTVGELPSLPGSRRSSEQRKLSDGSGSSVDAAYELARRLSEAGVRRMSDASIVLTADTDSFIIGERVYVNGVKPGVIQFIGETKFAPGDWAGIVLDDASGKNEGSVGGVRYFQCQPKKGVFSRLTRLTREPLDPAQLVTFQTQHADNSADSAHSADNHLQREISPSPISPTKEKNTMVSVQSIGNLRLGDRVIVTSSQGSKAGMLRFLGTTEFASGQWAGVELDDPLGKNDGAVAGTRYFDCQPFYGLFAPVHKVTPSPANHMRRTSGSVAGSMAGSMAGSVAGSTRGLGLTRQNTRDSFGSNASMISAVSRASTAVNQRKTSRTSPGTSSYGGLQAKHDQDGTVDAEGFY